ncbi:MAG: DUF983 domain-containing protein [Novosphingobium sp.]|nr:DUF983 domain-containing protein [Novosphingobium sp.]
MTAPPALPHTFWQAAVRGVKGRCPRCGEAALFRKWLKPMDRCAHCGQDWSHQRADDFPAYVAILLTGHILAPVMIALTADYDLSVITILAILIPTAIAMMLGLLQPAKGAIIAVQWWHGLHGFTRERAPEPSDTPGPA